MQQFKSSMILTVFLAFFSNPACAKSSDEPVELVANTAGTIFAELNDNREKYKSNPAELKTLVRDYLIPMLDVHYSARLILGRAGRQIESAKVDEFANAMIDLLVNRYSEGLLQFPTKQALRVLPQRGDLNEKLTRVRTRIMLPTGGEAPIDYAFHKTPEGWKAFDVVVEGISYVATYRNQIMPEVQANGIDSVIARLSDGELELAE